MWVISRFKLRHSKTYSFLNEELFAEEKIGPKLTKLISQWVLNLIKHPTVQEHQNQSPKIDKASVNQKLENEIQKRPNTKTRILIPQKNPNSYENDEKLNFKNYEQRYTKQTTALRPPNWLIMFMSKQLNVVMDWKWRRVREDGTTDVRRTYVQVYRKWPSDHRKQTECCVWL